MHIFVDIFSPLIVPLTPWTHSEGRKKWFSVRTIELGQTVKWETGWWPSERAAVQNWFLRNFVKTSKFGVSADTVDLSAVKSSLLLWQTETIRLHPQEGFPMSKLTDDSFLWINFFRNCVKSKLPGLFKGCVWNVKMCCWCDRVTSSSPTFQLLSGLAWHAFCIQFSYGFTTSEIVTNPGYLEFLKVVCEMSKLVTGVTAWQVQAPPSTFCQGLHGTLSIFKIMRLLKVWLKQKSLCFCSDQKSISVQLTGCA